MVEKDIGSAGINRAGVAMSTMPRLNPDLDPHAIASAFAIRGRTHIPAILTPESATRVQQCLNKETEYNVTINTPARIHDMAPSQIASLDSSQRYRMLDSVYKTAGSSFQMYYGTHRLSNGGEPYPDPDHFLASVVSFFNSEPFLAFARAVTGIPEIQHVDAQATRYAAGNFLTLHNDADDIEGRNRLVAYVLNMTPGWRLDWGGLLLFVDQNSNIEEGYIPAFNALNLFRVPQLHLVSQVTSFAQCPRYSVTGWMCGRSKYSG